MFIQLSTVTVTGSLRLSAIASGIVYTWYMAVQGSLYWYIPVRTLLATWWYEKPHFGTYQYILT
jgi:hypothetical protein